MIFSQKLNDRIFFRALCLAFLVSAINTELFAQTRQPVFERFDNKNLYNSGQVYDIVQDNFGFLWFATFNGVLRFDGVDFKHYEHDPIDTNTISGSRVLALAKDSQGRIWIASDGGVSMFDYATNRIVRQFQGDNIQNKAFSERTWSIIIDNTQRIWLGTINGLYTAVQGEPMPVRVNEAGQDEKKGPITQCIFEDWGGEIWAGCKALLQVNKTSRTYSSHLPNVDRAFAIHAICQTKENELWLGTNLGMFTWDIKLKRMSRAALGAMPDNCEILSLCPDRNGKVLWIGTRQHGLLMFNLEDNSCLAYAHQPNDPKSLSDIQVKSLLIDRDQNLWIGCFDGLNKYDLKPQKIHSYPVFRDGTTVFNSVLRVFYDATGTLWIKTRPRKLWRGQGQGDNMLDVGSGMVDPDICKKVTHFLEFPKKELWMFFESDSILVYSCVDKSFRLTSIQKDKPYRKINTGKFDPVNKDIVWLGIDTGLIRYNFVTKEMETFYLPKEWKDSKFSSVWQIQPDNDSLIWLDIEDSANFGYFNKYQKKFYQFQETGDTLRSYFEGYVYSMTADRKNNIWIASSTGLLKIESSEKKPTLYTRYRGQIPENHLAAIITDRDGNVWFTSPNYLSFIDMAQDEKFLHIPTAGINSFTTRAVSGSDSGRLIFFGGDKGLTEINLDLPGDTIAPKVILIGVKVFNKEIDLDKSPELTTDIELKFEQNIVTFEFAALHFAHPESNRYQYRLLGLGFDTTWTDAGKERRATFTNLWWGKYEFQVIAFNLYGIGSKTPLTVSITILPPWWGTKWAFSLYIIGLFSIFYGFYKFRLNRNLAIAESRRQVELADAESRRLLELADAESQKLAEMDAFKTRFYTNITHEFRTPLTVILGMAGQIKKTPLKWVDTGTQMISRQAGDLLRLVNQILDISKIEAGVLEKDMVQCEVVRYISYLTESFHSLALSKKNRLNYLASQDALWVDIDKEKLKTIYNNLLSNALKFTPPGGQINISLSVTGDAFDTSPALQNLEKRMKIAIQDTGPGIPPEYKERVFDRFFTSGTDRQMQGEGAGIGLAHSRELARLLGGDITLHSEPGHGATFVLDLPVTNQAAIETPTISQPVPDTAVPSGKNDMLVKTINTYHHPHLRLLIVEDSEDVSLYLKTLLEDHYQIEFAKDGQEGIEKALERIPDIIISDVMMPRTNGYELCRVLKNDPRTSHIPIVLLTAKAEREARMEGLDGGADDFLIKPFDEKELESRMRNLLSIRRNLQLRYQEGVPAEPTLNPVFQKQDEFFKKLDACLEQHYSRPEFNVTELCRCVNMSQTVLFNKLKALKEMNIADYIKHYRMRKAWEMLKNTDLSISEIATACGFKNDAHFSTVFRKTYGKSPSQARKE